MIFDTKIRITPYILAKNSTENELWGSMTQAVLLLSEDVLYVVEYVTAWNENKSS